MNICKQTVHLSLCFILLTFTVGCKKFVDVGGPVTSTNGEGVYTTDNTAIAVLTGIYINLSRGGINPNFAQGQRSISLLSGLSSDEFELYSGAEQAYSGYYSNALFASSTGDIGSEYWGPLYNYIFTCNSAIEGLNNSKNLTVTVKDQLLGEAKFLRAFFYFYLVNLFGDVPIVTTTEHTKTMSLDRSASIQVYQQIIDDLRDAEEMLNVDFLDGNLQPYKAQKERVRPTKWAAKALLARVYLYTKDYANAEIKATDLISNTLSFSLLTPNDVFKKNSNEAIWQIQPVTAGFNTQDARTFVIPSSGFSSTNPVRLSSFLLSQFDASDNRRKNGNWVNSITISNVQYYYPYKYKINTQNSSVTTTALLNEYLMVLRLGEQYLIRAEAKAMQGKFQEAIDDINAIRLHHAGFASSLPAPVSQSDAINIILRERQIELFSEWGHRWLDLKRTGTIGSVMSQVTPVKSGGTQQWKSSQQYYPIPFLELQKNQALIQNEGYSK